jgi:PAS domain S-box-containing protein
LVEDSEADGELLILELRRGGYDVSFIRVETGNELLAALKRQSWDMVISDYRLPQFDAMGALSVVQQHGCDLPFIIVSGTIGEDMAVAAMKAGAHDYLMKGNLKRLCATVERELREAKVRAERRQAEGELRSSEERFRKLVDSIPDLVFTLDRDHRYVGIFGRHHAKETLKPASWLHRTPEEIFGPETAKPHQAAATRALAGEHVVYEWSLKGQDEQRHFQTSLSAMRDDKGMVTGVIGVQRDITEHKRAQAQLLLSDRMVSVGTLAAGVAHEINNPLSAVLANLDLIKMAISSTDADPTSGNGASPASFAVLDEISEPLGDAREGAERVRQIVRDLRIFSRTDDERRGPVELHRVLESTLRMAFNEIRHRARLVKDYGQVPQVEGNESRLGQVFLNLIVNAAQAITEGRADKNEIRIVTRTDQQGRAVVEIRDTGSGIAPGDLPRIFDPFFTTKPIGIGTGLGLSICHRIVTSMSGEIQMDSELGKGTVVRVSLQPTRAEPVQQPKVTERPQPATRRGRILIVDDEPMIGSTIGRVLVEHEVTIATSAQQALQQLRQGNPFDVILCDLMMPDMTGMDLHAEMLRVSPEEAKKMIFVTGGVFTPGAREFLDRTPNQRIEKPFDNYQLRALINDRLR